MRNVTIKSAKFILNHSVISSCILWCLCELQGFIWAIVKKIKMLRNKNNADNHGCRKWGGRGRPGQPPAPIICQAWVNYGYWSVGIVGQKSEKDRKVREGKK